MNKLLDSFPDRNWKNAVFPIAVGLLAFAIPIVNHGLQFVVAIVIAAWILYPKRSLKPLWKPFVVFSGIFVFYLAGVFYSSNVSNGVDDVVQKLSLVIFPLMFATAKPLDSRYVRMVKRIFVLGTIAALMIAYGTSVFDFIATGDIREMYMSNFSPVLHPSYLALFINLSIAILLLEIDRESRYRHSELKLWAVVLLLALSLIFPAAKMGVINFGLLMVFFLVLRGVQGNFFHVRTALLVAVGVLFLVFFKMDPLASGRLSTMVEVLEGSEEGLSQPAVESTTARLHIWKTLWSELPAHPFGVGGGDTKSTLREWYAKNDLDVLADGGHDAHNQYLHTAVAVGIPAALWFIFSLVYPLRRIWKKSMWIYAFFLMSIAINFAVESMLEKQSGIVFFTFFNALFYFFGLRGTDENVPVNPAP